MLAIFLYIIVMIAITAFGYRSLTPEYEITIGTLVIIAIAIIYTAFTFYYIGQVSVMNSLYY